MKVRVELGCRLDVFGPAVATRPLPDDKAAVLDALLRAA